MDNTNGLSISFRVDDGVIEHNKREIISKNVDTARIGDDIIYTQIELKQFYDQIFGEALAEYNVKQKRSDRRINDYYEHIKKSGTQNFSTSYAFQNDAEINYLSERLCTIHDFGFVSQEQMFDKATEFQDYINNNPKCDIEMQQLKRINELIKVYEEIVEGNYIDNLIKAQNKRKQEHTQKHSR